MKNIILPDEEEYSMSYQELRFELEPTPENEARERRRDEFVKASLLKEVVLRTSPKHQRMRHIIRRETNGHLDHVSFWELENMAVILNEPYYGELSDFYHDQLYTVEVPPNISPYCGPHLIEPDAIAQTKSFLTTTRLKKAQLQKVLNRLVEAEKLLPHWNYVGKETRCLKPIKKSIR